MNSQSDKLKGKFNSSVGKVKQVAGKAINDKGLESRGLIQKAKGKGQQMRGAIKEKIQKGSHAVGDAVEKLGNKLEHIAD